MGISSNNVTARSDAQRQRIELLIKIAHKLFEKNGYDQVGIREICQPAGLTPTQLYRLGLSKQDLLAEVILRVNQKQINAIKPFSSKDCKSAVTFIEKYLLNLYKVDIQIKGIRSEGAAFGWKWSGRYEALIVKQVFQLIEPIADALAHEGYDAIQARCFAIWSLYYVGYRHAVMHNADAADCLDEILPSLHLCLKK